MKALIDPTQNNRIVEVREEEFAVAEPYFWKECDETVAPHSHIYVNGEFVLFNINKIIEEITLDSNKLLTYKNQLLEDPRYDFSYLNNYPNYPVHECCE